MPSLIGRSDGSGGFGGGGAAGLASDGAFGLGSGQAVRAAWVAASRVAEDGSPGGVPHVAGSPSFSAESGATGGPATRSACVSGISIASL